ncbi:MAG: tetratricopeptide repeat protein, partial [Gammaproteobacteria bacterium]|nr:tetratricopeptide repeat protein [Gammaproteobacteria bacterium]
ANSLVKQSRANEAYEMLLPLESSRAGDPAFDYMLGVSAMESGDLSNAVFALQRAVAVKPDFVGAKMDLARTYYKLDEMREAKQEFLSIFQFEPSARLQEIINLYLSNINRKQQKKASKRQSSISLNVSAGYDSNANSAPSIDNYLGIVLDENSRKKPSSYVSTAANLSFVSPLSKNEIFTYGGGFSQRSNTSTRFINSSSFVFSSGYLRKLNAGALAVNAQLFQAYVTGSYSGRNLAGIAQYSFPEKNGQNIGLMTNLSMFRANPVSSIRDTNQYVLGVSFNSRMKKANTPDSVISFSTGKAVTLKANSPYGKEFSNVRLTLSKNPNIKLTPSVLMRASASITNTRYSGLFNGQERRENLNTVEFATDIPFRKNAKLTFSASHNTNDSSINLYTYNRDEFKTVLLWMFR